MATIEVATGEVIVLSDRPEVMDLIELDPSPKRASCVEDLEQMIVEGNHPVVIVDEKVYRGCDTEALILDLAEFERDRVGGIVILVSADYEKNLLPDLRLAGANRFVQTVDVATELEQMVCEARAERWRLRDLEAEGITF